jgi:hypothetical protein
MKENFVLLMVSLTSPFSFPLPPLLPPSSIISFKFSLVYIGSSKTNPAKITRKKQIKLSKNESQEGPLNTTHAVASADGNTAKKMHPHIYLFLVFKVNFNF